jgi:hypothetical protein
VVRRQASSGAAPARNSRVRPSGVIHWLKNSGFTETRSPLKASVMVGNIVTNQTKTAQASRIQLLTRNANSRDQNDSNELFEPSLLPR